MMVLFITSGLFKSNKLNSWLSVYSLLHCTLHVRNVFYTVSNIMDFFAY